MIGEWEVEGGTDYYDLWSKWKLFFKINVAGFSPLPTPTHYHKMKIIKNTELSSLNIILRIFE